MKNILSTLLVLSLFVSATALAKAKPTTKKTSRGPASASACRAPQTPDMYPLASSVRLRLPEIEKYAELLAKWGNYSLYCLAEAPCADYYAYQLQHQRWGQLDLRARLSRDYEMVPEFPALMSNGRQIQAAIPAHRDDFDSVSTRAFNVASLAFIQRRDGVYGPNGTLTTPGVGKEAACAAEATAIARYKDKNTVELLDFIREEISNPQPAAAAESVEDGTPGDE